MFKALLARARRVRADEFEGESGLEAGFTLIELMVVLLIIAILLAIAIPTFLGVSGGARDRSAQSNVSNALTDVIAYYQNGQTFISGAGLSTTMNTNEPTFTWVSPTTACTAVNASKCVSVTSADVATLNDGQATVVTVLSGNSNNCWFVANLQQSGAAAITGDASAFIGGASGSAGFQSYVPPGGSSGALTAAGTYYAMKPNDVTSGTSNCEASQVETNTGGWTWYPSFSAAQANPD